MLLLSTVFFPGHILTYTQTCRISAALVEDMFPEIIFDFNKTLEEIENENRFHFNFFRIVVDRCA